MLDGKIIVETKFRVPSDNGHGAVPELKTAAEPGLARARDTIVGGLRLPNDETGDCYKFTCALADLSAGLGVGFRFGTPVAGLREAGGRIVAAQTAAGEIEGDAFVAALGSYTPALLRPFGMRLPVYPVKGYSITLPLGPAEVPAAPSVSLTDEAYKLVISRLGERLRIAGTAELAGYDTSVNEVRCNAILHRVRQLFPQLGAIHVVETWAGLRPATPNNIPVIGRTRLRNLYLNTGHGTLGWTLACGSGRATADLVSGRPPGVPFDFLA